MLFSLVGFKRNLSLLAIFLFFQGILTKRKSFVLLPQQDAGQDFPAVREPAEPQRGLRRAPHVDSYAVLLLSLTFGGVRGGFHCSRLSLVVVGRLRSWGYPNLLLKRELREPRGPGMMKIEIWEAESPRSLVIQCEVSFLKVGQVSGQQLSPCFPPLMVFSASI